MPGSPGRSRHPSRSGVGRTHSSAPLRSAGPARDAGRQRVAERCGRIAGPRTGSGRAPRPGRERAAPRRTAERQQVVQAAGPGVRSGGMVTARSSASSEDEQGLAGDQADAPDQQGGAQDAQRERGPRRLGIWGVLQVGHGIKLIRAVAAGRAAAGVTARGISLKSGGGSVATQCPRRARAAAVVVIVVDCSITTRRPARSGIPVPTFRSRLGPRPLFPSPVGGYPRPASAPTHSGRIGAPISREASSLGHRRTQRRHSGSPGPCGFAAGRGGLTMIESLQRLWPPPSISPTRARSCPTARRRRPMTCCSSASAPISPPARRSRAACPICWPWFGRGPGGPGPGRSTASRAPALVGPGAPRPCRAAPPASPWAWRTTPRPAPSGPIISTCWWRSPSAPPWRVELITRNAGDRPFQITQGLHTYFRVGDATRVRVLGLEGCPYIDKAAGAKDAVVTQEGPVTVAAEVNRIYESVPPGPDHRGPGAGAAHPHRQPPQRHLRGLESLDRDRPRHG